MPVPLTLGEQLDAMLSGWLDRHDPDGQGERTGRTTRAIITVAESAVPELEAFCARWELTVRQTARRRGPWSVLVVEGSELRVDGLAEITSMYRR